MRIGILSFLLAFALLTGNPLAGALLTSQHLWHRPLIFAAVRRLFQSALFGNSVYQPYNPRFNY